MIKNIIIIVISILILIIYLQKGNNETFTVDYNWQQPTVKCSENQNKIYINADSNNYSIINVNESECQKNCENQEDCEMYLMSDENTCNLYNNYFVNILTIERFEFKIKIILTNANIFMFLRLVPLLIPY